MKISAATLKKASNVKIRCQRNFNLQLSSAFTLIEIAICLAIIGIALVAIIGVLPLGMNTQRDNREETIINQDATVLLEAVRNGTRGMDDLTNYVLAITNYEVYFADGNSAGTPISPIPGWSVVDHTLTNGAQIVGILSSPELTDLNFYPTNNLYFGGYSNHVYVTVRSLSGLATEKPPQNNDIMLSDSFTYRILCANVSAMPPLDVYAYTNFGGDQNYSRQLSLNQHEIRMTFLWPLQPNGKLGIERQTFRATVAGQYEMTNINSQLISINNQPLYFYQPQSFLADTNSP